MANRINQLDGGSVSSGTGSAVESVLPAKPVGSAATGTGSSSNGTGTPTPDSVHITASGRALASLSQAVQDTPDVDGSRVATLQQAIASGHYAVDADTIAAGMLQLEQDLGGTAQ